MYYSYLFKGILTFGSQTEGSRAQKLTLQENRCPKYLAGLRCRARLSEKQKLRSSGSFASGVKTTHTSITARIKWYTSPVQAPTEQSCLLNTAL